MADHRAAEPLYRRAGCLLAGFLLLAALVAIPLVVMEVH